MKDFKIQEWQLREIKQGIAETNAGQLIDHIPLGNRFAGFFRSVYERYILATQQLAENA